MGGVVYYLHGHHGYPADSLHQPCPLRSGSTCGGDGAEISGSRTLYYPYGEVRVDGTRVTLRPAADENFNSDILGGL